ncbi:hypothetical protein UA08_07535 [Talaromyces atroroseus]|uniref:Uncharacterized protein n=1 Tax=Talaromyces atroroseus TaxID=1441469 RepID=A0A225A978_TALAT|nr:hypothetical protein UA08_07535 [Talaromyces atroroseus]OKL57391.1 hypothetical protein UA08_07535 [Talaromyces atroroseus]
MSGRVCPSSSTVMQHGGWLFRLNVASGYSLYLAGALCYRDGRMRYLVTWTSSIIYCESEEGLTESIGLYGVEGMTEGLVVGPYLSYQAIGLHKDGYLTLLGEALFTGKRLYCHWATLMVSLIEIGDVSAKLLITPFNMLPAERDEGNVEAPKEFTREHIIQADNEDLMLDPEAVQLLQQLGMEDEVKAMIQRNVEFPNFHGFIIQGYEGERLCGVHLPMFNMQNHRTQAIISFTLPLRDREVLVERKKRNPKMFLTVGNKEPALLSQLIKDGASFTATLQDGFPWDKRPISDNLVLSDVKPLLRRSLASSDLSSTYPEKMTFFVYSAHQETIAEAIFNMDHLLSCSPNVQLNSEMMTLECKQDSAKTGFEIPGLRFLPGETFSFEAFKSEDDPSNLIEGDVQFMGQVRIGPSVLVDYSMLNADGGTESNDGAKEALLGIRADISGLVTEYPNSSYIIELRNGFQRGKIQESRSLLPEVQRNQAKKLQGHKSFVSRILNIPVPCRSDKNPKLDDYKACHSQFLQSLKQNSKSQRDFIVESAVAEEWEIPTELAAEEPCEILAVENPEPISENVSEAVKQIVIGQSDHGAHIPARRSPDNREKNQR